jgi:hypothetical protein
MCLTLAAATSCDVRRHLSEQNPDAHRHSWRFETGAQAAQVRTREKWSVGFNFDSFEIHGIVNRMFRGARRALCHRAQERGVCIVDKRTQPAN